MAPGASAPAGAAWSAAVSPGTPAVSPGTARSSSPAGTHEPSPSPPSAAGPWESAQVDEPSAVTDAPAGSPPTICSPCHAAQISLAFAAAPTPAGFVAVGIQEPPAFAVAWSSQDGRAWARVASFPVKTGTAALAVTAGSGRLVVVGSDPAGAASWASADGMAWTGSASSSALAGPAGATRMTGVTAWNGAFVAVGYSGDPLHDTETAAVWTSPDGISWQRLPATGTVFAGGRMLGVAAGRSGLVAVGTTGDETHGSGAAWFSRDGTTWSRVDPASLAGGILRAVTAAGGGFLAVGLRATDDGAAAWQSADGRAWNMVPDQSSFRIGTSPARMVAVAEVRDGFVAVGWKSDAGNGSAAAWTSADGAAWSRDPPDTSFSGAEMAGIATSGTATVAVGTSGYPDNDAASMWLRTR